MLWLAAHMQFLLFTAFFIGLGAGWWIWGARRTRPRAMARREEALMGTLDSDYEPAPSPETAPQADQEPR